MFDEKSESYLLDKVLFDFLNALKGTSLCIKTNQTHFGFDFTIQKENGQHLAYVEVKYSLDNSRILRLLFERFNSFECDYLVVTDGFAYVILKRNDSVENLKNLRYQRQTLGDVIDLLVKRIKDDKQNKQYEIDYKKIKQTCVTKLNEKLSGYTNEKISELNRLIESLDIRYDGCSFVVYNEREIETKLFKNIFIQENSFQICRYTSLKSAFETVKNSNFLMFSIVGMNDKTEVNYVSSYVNEDDVDMLFCNLPTKQIDSCNRTFIMSCSDIEKKDDLTQWRLYADDAKGVCFVFDVDSKAPGFKLGRVQYADENGIIPELEFLKIVKQVVDAKLKKYHLSLKYNFLSKYENFFKPYDYAVEKEIRLLYDEVNYPRPNEKKWMLLDSVGIISPYLVFDENDFPLKLNEIVIGPKNREKEVNVKQFEMMIGKSVSTSISLIRNYR